MATAAVLADLRRRFVVVDIINWPVSYLWYLADLARGSEAFDSNLIGSHRLYKV
jgi:hypothetical protein